MLTKTQYYVIGVMSGTSLDGVDIIYIAIDCKVWNFKILNASTMSYSSKWIKRLKNAVNFSEVELEVLDLDYTKLLGNYIKDFIFENSIVTIDGICSHGHTILHQPEKGITYQIGNLPILSKILKEKVICDFRVQDVKLGGQGAPLVPIGDQLLFSDYDYCLNLGGFANISYKKQSTRIAFDVCPVNIVLNHYCNKIGKVYDDKGIIASKGQLNSDLLSALNSLKFYKNPPPKSLGLEWVKKEVFPLIDSFKLSVDVILRTIVEHIAIQTSNVFNAPGKVLVTGGGAYNDFLIKRIEDLSTFEIIIPSKEIIEYKEALIFGLLGVLKMRNEINCLSSVTGSRKDHSSGVIYNY